MKKVSTRAVFTQWDGRILGNAGNIWWKDGDEDAMRAALNELTERRQRMGHRASHVPVKARTHKRVKTKPVDYEPDIEPDLPKSI